MPRPAASVTQMRRSGIREIMDLANAMTEVIRLELGDPNFPTPAHITDAAFAAARQGYTHYTTNAGLLSLREKLARKMERVNGLSVEPANIVVTTGGMGALSTLLATITEPGDEILIPDPGFPNYELTITATRGVPKHYQLDPQNGFLPSLDTVEAAVGPRTKALLLNSPSNPTGSVIPRDLILGLLEIARRHDLFVLSDEVYEEIVFEGEHVSPLSFDQDGRVIGIFSFSKTYAMTGWRLGYLVSSNDMAALLTKMQEPFTSCAASVSQKAGEAALDGPQECVAEMRAAYKRRRDLAVNLLDEFKVGYSMPRGAFYLMINISRKGLDSYTFAKMLLKEHHVAVAPGDTFGPAARNYVRISLASADADIAEGVRRIASVLCS